MIDAGTLRMTLGAPGGLGGLGGHDGLGGPAKRTAEDADAPWVAASLRGDEAAFSALVRRNERRVFALAGRFFRRREEVEEVAQETFLRAWQKLSSYRAEAPFEHWLSRICLRTAYDRLRREKGRAVDVLDEEVAAPGADPDARLEVERLLSHLVPLDRFLLTLLLGEGLSVAEVAERLGLSRVNVKVRAHRARQRLRRLLEEG